MSLEPPDVLCIYRLRNAAHARDVVTAAQRAGGTAYLWALDEPDPQLSAWTRGTGPGARLTLLNRLDALTVGRGPLVVCDDDVAMAPVALRRLMHWGRVARLDVFQPAHAGDSHVNHDVTRQRRTSLVRITRFVEVGPVVAFSRRARPRVTPFPEELGMGWGLDLRWSALVDEGLRLGIVDAVTIAHLSPAAGDYATDGEERSLTAETAAVGVDHLSVLHVPLSYWPWGPRALTLAKSLRNRLGGRQVGR